MPRSQRPKGEVRVVGVQLGQEPGRIRVRREELDDRFGIEVGIFLRPDAVLLHPLVLRFGDEFFIVTSSVFGLSAIAGTQLAAGETAGGKAAHSDWRGQPARAGNTGATVRPRPGLAASRPAATVPPTRARRTREADETTKRVKGCEDQVV